MHDVAIVGAGPGGSAAAHFLARAGADVVLLGEGLPALVALVSRLDTDLSLTAEQLTAGYLSPDYRDAITFVILIFVLILRPEGLLGVVRPEKV